MQITEKEIGLRGVEGVVWDKDGRDHRKGGNPSLWLERGPERGCLKGKE